MKVKLFVCLGICEHSEIIEIPDEDLSDNADDNRDMFFEMAGQLLDHVEVGYKILEEKND